MSGSFFFLFKLYTSFVSSSVSGAASVLIEAVFEDEICNSSRIRQKRLLSEANEYDLVIVVGDKHSNNTQTLFKMAKEKYCNAINISSKEQLHTFDLYKTQNVLILSGASVMKEKVEEIIKFLKNLWKWKKTIYKIKILLYYKQAMKEKGP